MLSRKCSRDEPSHNIGAFFNTIGQNRKSPPRGGMSAFARRADIGRLPRHVRFVLSSSDLCDVAAG